MSNPLAELRPMTIEDYEAVAALWQATAGLGTDPRLDTRTGLAAYLARNPGLSLIASRGGQLVGAVLCGHDGRRGSLHHLAVASECRRQGLGRALVDACLAALGALGIPKCNIFVYADNAQGLEFWQHHGWAERPDLKLLQHWTPDSD